MILKSIPMILKKSLWYYGFFNDIEAGGSVCLQDEQVLALPLGALEAIERENDLQWL